MKKIKMVCALLIIAVLFQASAFAANDALVYNAALEKLQQYKDLDDAQDAYDGFTSITSDYGQSVLLAAYCSAIIDIHNENWDSATRVLEKLGTNESFVSLIQGNNLPTCSQLETYINGREKENSGDFDGAVALYNQILDVWDAMSRTVKIEGAKGDQNETEYNQGIAYITSGDYVRAAEIFATLGDYKDSKTQLMLALSMANGTVPASSSTTGTLSDSDIRLAANQAAELLENGDRTAAIRQCANVLSVAATNTDLDTSALETTMLSAMGVFSQGELFVGNPQTYDFDVSISAFQVLNGNTLVTLDSYGMLEAFDITTHSPLWTKRMAGFDHESGSAYTDETARIFSNGNGIMIAKYILQFSAFTSSGDEIWTRYQKSNTGYESLFSLSDDGQLFAYVDESKDAPYYYYLVVCETATGNCVGKYKLTDASELHGQNSLSGYVASRGRNQINGKTDCSIKSAVRGTFSDDKTRYYMAVKSGDRLAYYTVFLDNHGDSMADGQYRITYASDIGSSEEDVIAIDAIDSDLIVYHVSRESGVVSITERINMYGGYMTWVAQANRDGIYNINGDYTNACYLRSGSRIYTTLDDYIYIFDVTTGEKLTGAHFTDGAKITSLYDLGNGFVQVTISSGEVGLCWLNSFGLHFSEEEIIIPKGSAALVTGNLIKEVIAQETLFDQQVSSMKGVTVNPDQQYVLVIPEDTDSSIVEYHLLSSGGYSHKLDCMEDDHLLDASTMTADPFPIMDAGNEIMIRIDAYLYSGANGKDNGFIVIDANTQELKDTIYFDQTVLSYRTDIPETREYIKEISGTNAELTVINPSTGETRILAAPENADNLSPMVVSKSIQRDRDGTILTAYYDGETLQWWINAKDGSKIVVPEEAKHMITNYVDHRANGLKPAYSDTDPFAVGGCGLIVFAKLVKSEEDDYEENIESFYGYNIETGEWLSVEDEVHGDDFRRIMAVGQEKEYLAVVDADDQIRVYDMHYNDVIQHINLKMPGNAIRNMTFAINDEYLLVNYNNRVTELWNVKTGERVLREDLEGQSIKADKDQHRAYLIDHNEGIGICYDMSTWSKLMTIEGAEYYDSRRANLYTFDREKGLYVINVPTLEQMILAGLTA